MFDVIVLDLDGTLLRNDKTVSEETLKALRRWEELGKQIVIATARPPRLGAIKLPEELQKEFMIFYNGAEIYHNKEKIYSKCISFDSLESIKNLLLNSYNQCRVSFEIDNKLYANFNIEGFFGNIEFETISLDTFELMPTTKILLDISSIDNIKVFKANLPCDCHMVVTDNGSLGQIMAYGVNKSKALRYILQKLKTSIDKVMFFGDDVNDIELIKECGIGIAMGNAVLSVKEVADYVTKSNEEDGIAVFLSKLCS
jgi:5-amino-6-(5-phospho-D-ribitylamino)uracil phosphatase